MNLSELKTRLKGCWNILTDHHPMIKQPTDNCPCYDKNGNQIGWWSRSMAITLFPFIHDEKTNEWYVLASQRGEGTPDPEYRGCWNVITGYLDCNETLAPKNFFSDYTVPYVKQNACCRECLEETGVDLSNEKIEFWSYNDNPHLDKRQNVTFRFITMLSVKDKGFYESQFSHKMNEKDEVGEIKFIKFSEIHKYKWAFNHESLIHKAFVFYMTNYEETDKIEEID